MSEKKPLYKQIMDKLKERIKSGDFEYDAPFVTEDRITKEYGVSPVSYTHLDVYKRQEL